METLIEQLHEWLIQIAYLTVYFLEALSLASVIYSTFHSLLATFRKDNNSKKPLLRGLSIALTFKLAAEIVRTITVRSLAEILQIGALILVKAAITFLIHWEWKSSDVMHKDVDEFE